MKTIHPLLTLTLVTLTASGGRARTLDAQVPSPADSVSPGWIGVQANGTAVHHANGSVRTDVLITSVVDGSPADQAGLRPGDRIMQLNGRGLTLESFVRTASTLKAGDRLRLLVSRGPWPREVDIQAVQRPAQNLVGLPQDVALRVDSAMLRLDSLLWLLAGSEMSDRARTSIQAAQAGRNRLVAIGADSTRTVIIPTWNHGPFDPRIPGIEAPARSADPVRVSSPHVLGQNRVAGAALIGLNAELADYFQVAGGLLVTDITPGTPAAEAGIRPGDVVVRVGDTPVASLSDLRSALAPPPSGNLALGLVRRGEALDVSLPR